MALFFEVDVSKLSQDEKMRVYNILDKMALHFEEVACAWLVDAFHFMTEDNLAPEEVRKRFMIPEICAIRPYVHPR